jgi:REP element-mobilizing transposase RayT
MARPWRIEYEGAYYHVFSRGNEGRDIFYDEKDRKIFLGRLGEMSNRFEIDVYAFVLMANHYHLLIQTKLANLSRAMQWIGVSYTRRFNNRHSRSGHLFQGRFKSIVVENDAYVVELSCYIHRNPLRAGIVKRLMDFKWSSYPVYAYGRKGPEWLKTDLILSFFSGGRSRQAYRDKVQHYAKEEKSVLEDFRHGLIVGTHQFVDKIKAQYVLQVPHQEIPQQKGLVGRINTKLFLEQVSRLFNCEVHRFKRAGRLFGEDKDLRDLLVFFLWERGSYTNREIGEVFSLGYTSVSHIVKKVKNHLKANSKYGKMYDSINSQIKM